MAYSYTVVGVGAVGGCYGGWLAQAGFDVRFLARGGVAELQRSGLHVRSPDGDVTLASVKLCDAASPASDIVLVAVKATANAEVADTVARLVRPGGLVVVVQNGLGGDEVFARAAPHAHVIGGLSMIAATKLGPGRIEHTYDRALNLARWTADGSSAAPTPLLDQLAAELERAGIPVTLSDNLALARWRKLVWSISVVGLCVALAANTREVVEDPHTLRAAGDLMDEVIAAAAACGHQIDAAVGQRLLDEARAMPAFEPSLKRDFDAGRALELDVLYANPLAAARRAGFAAPRIDQLYRLLCFLVRRRG